MIIHTPNYGDPIMLISSPKVEKASQGLVAPTLSERAPFILALQRLMLEWQGLD